MSDEQLVAAAARIAYASGVSIADVAEALERVAARHERVEPTMSEAWGTGWHTFLVDLPYATFTALAGLLRQVGHATRRGIRRGARATWRGARAVAHTVGVFGEFIADPFGAGARRRGRADRMLILEQRLDAFGATDEEIDTISMFVAVGMPARTMRRIFHQYAGGRAILLENEASGGDDGSDPLVRNVRRWT